VGGSGGGGTGGLSTCNNFDGQGDVVELAIVGSDGTAIETAVSAAVTVASVDSCAAVSCPSFVSGLTTTITTSAQRITLTAAGPQQWTFYLRDSAMPADFIKVGDTFDMTIDASVDAVFYRTVNQTIVLARGGNLIVFAAGLQRFVSPPVPDLDAFGLHVSDQGATCQEGGTLGGGCVLRPHTALIAASGSDASIVLGSGGTAKIAGLSVTVGQFMELFDGGACDSKSSTVMAGFREGNPGASGIGGTGGTGAGGTGGTGAGGTGGTSAGGTGGTSAGGTGGSGLPACGSGGNGRFAPGSNAVELAIVDSNGMLIESAVTSAVTVASMASCASVTCPTYFSGFFTAPPPISAAATRIVLAGPDPMQWTLYLRNDRMPADFIKVGDAFALTVDAAVEHVAWGTTRQTVVLARGSDLFVFATAISQYRGPALPDLTAFGIQVTSGGGTCDDRKDPNFICGYRWYSALVTVAAESASVFGTAQVGWLSFTNGGFSGEAIDYWGNCDSPSTTRMAGFRVP
jgi:hypothetical protein